jgi:hypothetical protein
MTASRDGRFEVVRRDWIGNGEFVVDVADLASISHDAEAYAYAPTPEAARRTARRADPMRLTRRTTMTGLRLISTRLGFRVAYRFVIAR